MMHRSDSSAREEHWFSLLKDVVLSDNKQLNDTFGETFLRQLSTSVDNNNYRSNIQTGERNVFKGYPNGNYLRQIAKVLELWASHASFPITFLGLNGFDSETTAGVLSKLDSFTTFVTELAGRLTDPIAPALMEQLVMTLGPRGILTCLGVRRTQGSIDKYCLPNRSALEAAFNHLHAKEERKTNLSVGARALSKHAHRSSEGFWGKAAGTEENRNQQAATALQRLLDECAWINIHSLPNDEPVIECRVIDGYGARWFILNQNAFRGLLEPQMEGGHDRRWRH